MRRKNYVYKLATRGVKTSIIGILTSFILAAIKIFSGIFGNSYALIADGIESVSDVLSSFVVLTGLKIAVRPADENHPYGHGKAEPLAGMVVAFGLFLAAMMIIIQSIYEIITPHHAPEPFTLIVLVAVVLTKEFLFRYVIKVGDQIDSVAVKNDAWHHRSDAMTSGAAFIGILIALIGGAGYEEADDFAALFASIIILINAYRLVKPAIYELMDATPSTEMIDKVRAKVMETDEVLGVDKCFIRKMGLQYYVDIHVIVDGSISVTEGHDIAHIVKANLFKYNPLIIDVLVHIEPDSEFIHINQ